MHYGLAGHFGANVDKHLEEKENMDNDQVDIKLTNMKNDIATTKAWIEQVSKSEALHAERVIAMSLEMDTLNQKVKTLEACEDLRDDQMKVLQKVITNLMKYIEKTNNEKEDKDDKEFQILDIPKATK
jgi:L-ascorbate metabolism protein UlaG (beta-lactamase superfamily)|tara:strand:+ start:330 stop:713 length:384 start_codon:yes stop_codon:yes gene_type:complete